MQKKTQAMLCVRLSLTLLLPCVRLSLTLLLPCLPFSLFRLAGTGYLGRESVAFDVYDRVFHQLPRNVATYAAGDCRQR